MKQRQFSFWCPGGRTGKITGSTAHEAAQQVLKTRDVQHVRGDSLTQPWQFVGGGSECKLWLAPPECPGQVTANS